jgi:hypothetical protein
MLTRHWIAVAMIAFTGTAKADPSILEGTVWSEAAIESVCKVDPLLLYAVALVESRGSAGAGFIRPNQFALRNAPSGSRYPKTHEEAALLLPRYIAEDRLTDIGAMQINYRWNGHRVDDPIKLLDLKTNVLVGAQILCEAIAANPKDLRIGIGGYHTMNPDRIEDAIRYGENVLYIWKRLRGEA